MACLELNFNVKNKTQKIIVKVAEKLAFNLNLLLGFEIGFKKAEKKEPLPGRC